MRDIVLDACVLPEFLSQYFGITNHGVLPFQASGTLCQETSRQINRIRDSFDAGRAVAVVASSALAFVELSRKWKEMVANRFQPYQVAAFLAQPPEWFFVVPMDESIAEFLLDVPVSVISGSDRESIELYDAIHVATAFSRGEDSALVTVDRRLCRIPELLGRILGDAGA